MPMFRLNPGFRMARTCPGHNDSRAATDASSECERGHRGEECGPGLDRGMRDASRWEPSEGGNEWPSSVY